MVAPFLSGRGGLTWTASWFSLLLWVKWVKQDLSSAFICPPFISAPVGSTLTNWKLINPLSPLTQAQDWASITINNRSFRGTEPSLPAKVKCPELGMMSDRRSSDDYLSQSQQPFFSSLCNMLTGTQPAIIKSAAHNNIWISMEPLMARLSVVYWCQYVEKMPIPTHDSIDLHVFRQSCI